MTIDLSDYQLAKILEAGRFISELGNGPDLSDICEMIEDQRPDIKEAIRQ